MTPKESITGKNIIILLNIAGKYHKFYLNVVIKQNS
jgi:hypothetical protein